ncbi:MAG: cell division protein FtsA [bacterium]
MKRGDNIIAGLDIGSSNVRMAVGQVVASSEGTAELQILAAAQHKSEGMGKGKINSIEDVVSSVSACYERAERMAGVPIDSVWVSISGMHIMAQLSKGVVAVSRANNEISEEDVNRAIEAARSIATPLNYEILHSLPRSYAVDGQMSIKDPVGMTGIRLEVDSNIILGFSTQVKNLSKAVYRAGLEIEDLVLSILASASAVLTKKQKELGVVIIDIGASTTSVAVFEEGEMIHVSVIPLGSDNITNDLALGLRSSVEIADAVKLEFGDCSTEKTDRRAEVDLHDVGLEGNEMVKQRYINEIIEARVEEILQKVDDELRKIQRSGMLPAGAVFVGAGSKLPGLTDCAKKVLRLPACLGYPLDLLSVTDKINDLGFATAVGLVRWGVTTEKGLINRPAKKIINQFGRAGGRIKKLFKTLIP